MLHDCCRCYDWHCQMDTGNKTENLIFKWYEQSSLTGKLPPTNCAGNKSENLIFKWCEQSSLTGKLPATIRMD